MIRPAAPISSAATPMLLICDSSFTPMQLMRVVSPTMMNPSSRPFLANAGSRKVGKFSSGQVIGPDRAAFDDLERGRDLGQDHLPADGHGGHRDDLRAQVDPAVEPRPVLAGDLLRPLVDRAGQRVVRGQLGELEGDHHLPEEDDRPEPDERPPGEQEAEVGRLEHAGQDRDVREAGGEARERAERPIELLLVAETRQVSAVVIGCGHAYLPVIRHPSTGRSHFPAAVIPDRSPVVRPPGDFAGPRGSVQGSGKAPDIPFASSMMLRLNAGQDGPVSTDQCAVSLSPSNCCSRSSRCSPRRRCGPRGARHADAVGRSRRCRSRCPATTRTRGRTCRSSACSR